MWQAVANPRFCSAPLAKVAGSEWIEVQGLPIDQWALKIGLPNSWLIQSTKPYNWHLRKEASKTHRLHTLFNQHRWNQILDGNGVSNRSRMTNVATYP